MPVQGHRQSPGAYPTGARFLVCAAYLPDSMRSVAANRPPEVACTIAAIV